MQTDERPPPKHWYSPLVSKLKGAWLAVEAAAEQEDPYKAAILKERLQITSAAMRREISDDEAERLYQRVGTREWWINRQHSSETSPER